MKLIKAFSKVTWYKISIKKTISFILYNSNEQLKMILRK